MTRTIGLAGALLIGLTMPALAQQTTPQDQGGSYPRTVGRGENSSVVYGPEGQPGQPSRDAPVVQGQAPSPTTPQQTPQPQAPVRPRG